MHAASNQFQHAAPQSQHALKKQFLMGTQCCIFTHCHCSVVRSQLWFYCKQLFDMTPQGPQRSKWNAGVGALVKQGVNRIAKPIEL